MAKKRVALVAAASAVLACVLAGGVQTDRISPSQGVATFAPQGPRTQGTEIQDLTRSSSGSPKPLRGKVIVIDPGHQLGNSHNADDVTRQVNAGGFQKPCNTSGTSTDRGFPESTFTWRVSRELETELEDRGATVYLTRHTNSYADWGPCIDDRGRRGNKVHADAVVSVHGDGAAPGTRGFFVIRPGLRRGWTDDIVKPSQQLAGSVRHGLKTAGARVSSAYGGDGYDVRTDLGTLNWSNVPIVMVELGNMRNRFDARHMTDERYRQHVYVTGLRRGLTSFVLR